MPNLYELMGEFAALQHASEEATDEELTASLAALDEAKGSLKSKIDGIARILSNMEGNIATFRAEEHRLGERRKTMENGRDRLRNWIRTSMDVLDVKSIKTDFHSVSISPGKERVVVIDSDLVPAEFVRVKREVDKTAVMKAYKEEGEFVAGCDYVRGEPVLRIR